MVKYADKMQMPLTPAKIKYSSYILEKNIKLLLYDFRINHRQHSIVAKVFKELPLFLVALNISFVEY